MSTRRVRFSGRRFCDSRYPRPLKRTLRTDRRALPALQSNAWRFRVPRAACLPVLICSALHSRLLSFASALSYNPRFDAD